MWPGRAAAGTAGEPAEREPDRVLPRVPDGPRDRPFVEVGSRVEPDSTVCIIEVMKMMNSVPAGVSGTIVEVCVENAALVEEGAALFKVEPS